MTKNKFDQAKEVFFNLEPQERAEVAAALRRTLTFTPIGSTELYPAMERADFEFAVHSETGDSVDADHTIRVLGALAMLCEAIVEELER